MVTQSEIRQGQVPTGLGPLISEPLDWRVIDRPGIERVGVTVLRPRDLLTFSASWQGLTLQNESMLVADGGAGTLTITFPFQHVGEAAREKETLPPLPPPVAARAARPSRLVFAVPQGTQIEYSVAGLLNAIGTLELAVAPAAAGPATIWRWGVRAAGTTVGRLASPLTRYLLGAAQGAAAAITQPASRSLAIGGAGGTIASTGLARRVGAAQVALVGRRVIAGGGLTPGDVLDAPLAGRRTVKLPPVRAPKAGETAIEAPFRLILSPSTQGGWIHAAQPVAPADDRDRVELWHTRLASRRVRDGVVTLDETPDGQRTLRAIWTRDNDGFAPEPFNGSLTPSKRKLIVEQTSGSTRAPKVLPTPIQVRNLALSSLGAFLDVHVQWPWKNYPDGFAPLASWDHVAPMGRDQFVRVVTPGFLYPLGHAAYLVEITFRKVVGATNPLAGLFQRRFLVLGDPNRPYTSRDFPFVSAHVAPLRTPDLEPPPTPDPTTFIPHALDDPNPLVWRVDALDQDGRTVHLRMPMVWVRALAGVPASAVEPFYAPLKVVAADGQSIAFAPGQAAGDAGAGGQASAEALTLTLAASMSATDATPRLQEASVVVPAMKRLTPTAVPVTVRYADIYKAQGFAAANKGQVYLQLPTPSQLVFGSSDRSGGFVQPDVAVEALARGVGMVGDLAGAATGQFDPKKLFGSGFPKLFGLIDLWDIVETVAGKSPLDLAPKFLTDELNKVTALVRDLAQLRAMAESGELRDKAAALAQPVADAAAAVEASFEDVLGGKDGARAALHTALVDLQGALQALSAQIPAVPIGPVVRAALDRLVGAIGTAIAVEDKITEVLDAIEQFADNLDPGGRELRARMEWTPNLKAWPDDNPIFIVDYDNKKGGLTLSVETRVAAGKPPAADVAAELTHFALELLPGAQLMRVKFDRLAFRTTIGRKPEVDVVFGGIEFLGVLGFINTLSQIIPLDGFSDPPFVDVSTEGVTAGFTLALPNLAIGVFSLSNLAIAADARVPFLGETVSVGFAFCTREKPFTLAVAFLGGGGFVGIRLSPKGLVLLEAAFEFGAVVALDFGVASGSVSAMAGIYFRMEGEAASLTGYFRVRGEVDVLSLITASIELYMALSYAFDTGKMVGEATITVSVEVLFFSTSVSIHAQRTFAGSNGDPTVREMLLPDENGRSTIWEDYCAAFAPAKAEG